MDLQALRREYGNRGLHESEVDPDPIKQFRAWFEAASENGVADVNAMTLATVDEHGQPQARIVLLKGADSHGFVFFTNYESDKGRELAREPRASLCFYWGALDRQVRVNGAVEKLTRGESVDYFAIRPHGSQLGALASPQSRVIPGRATLEAELARLAAAHEGKPVKCPDHWGGYRLKPTALEFWQGRPDRLHDRLRYRLEGSTWILERLAP